MFQGSLLVIVTMLTAAKNVIMKAAFELQSSVYSPIPKCICCLPFNLTGLQVKKFCATFPYAFDISEQNHSKSYCDQNPTLIFQIFLIDFIPGLQTSKFR